MAHELVLVGGEDDHLEVRGLRVLLEASEQVTSVDALVDVEDDDVGLKITGEGDDVRGGVGDGMQSDAARLAGEGVDEEGLVIGNEDDGFAAHGAPADSGYREGEQVEDQLGLKEFQVFRRMV